MKHTPWLGHALLAASTLLWLPQAALLAWAIDSLARDAATGMAVSVRTAVGVLLLGLLKASLEAWGQRRVFVQARQHLTQLREHATAALGSRSPLDKQRPASGLAASMVAEQAEAIVPWHSRYQPAQWRTLLVPPAILLAVAVHSWLAALILLCSAPLIPLFMAIVGWRAKAASEEQMVELGGLHAFLLDRLRGLATLRALGAVQATATQLRRSGESLKERTMKVLRIAFLSSAVLELFSALGVALVAVYIGFHLLGEVPFGTWGQPLTLGQGLFVLMLAPAFFEPLRELSAAWHDRASGQAALANLALLQQPGVAVVTESSDSVQPVIPSAPAGMGIEMQQVDFAHGDEPPVLHGFDLSVQPGEHLAIVGASGSGKTVLLALLAGLLQARQGHIRLDGQPLDAGTIGTLRQQMAWMGQKPHIFTGSMHTNTTLERDRVDAQRVAETLAHSGIQALVERLPGQILGEGGTGLSGGEIARLALARLAANPQARLLLVDEPTAHLDSETAAQVIDTLLHLARGKTLLVATHDPLLMARLPRHVRLESPSPIATPSTGETP